MSTFAQKLSRTAWRVLPKRGYSAVVGWAGQRQVSPRLRPAVLGAFAARFGIDLDEAEKPLSEYTGIDDLFTRRLKPGARPVDPDPASLVLPADGRTIAVGEIGAGGRIEAKNIDLLVADLVAEPALAHRFVGGSYAVVYLSPRDYHRVHTPAAGRVLGWRHVPGQLLPVNEASNVREPGLFALNERVVSFFDGGSALGLFAVIMVAAVGVGHITLSYDPEGATHAPGAGDAAVRVKDFGDGPKLEKGDEVGIFHLGSTAIILFEKGRATLDVGQAGQVARMGARIGHTVS